MFFKYALKAMALDGCSEVCYIIGKYFHEKTNDINEAIIWYYNAAYETEPILTGAMAAIKPLEGLVKCYNDLGLENIAADYQKALDNINDEIYKAK